MTKKLKMTSRNSLRKHSKVKTRLYESENQVLPVFDEKTCSDYFIKSLKRNKNLRDFTPPSWMNSLDEPDFLFDITPPTYCEISKIVSKIKSSGSTFPFYHVSVIALKRCPILILDLHRIIVYC